MRKVLVFGVFDGLHEGHRSFLQQARQCGDVLVVAIARDETVEVLKGRRPKKELGIRKKELGESGLVDEVVLEDQKLGTWEVIGKHKPDIIALGYDQDRLRSALLEHIRRHDLDILVKVMEAYRPEELHSSLINNSKCKNQNAK